jgi:acetoacetyl-CoA synthetase
VSDTEGAGEVLWRPSEQRVARSQLTAFADRVAERHDVRFDDYEALWRWSVEHLEEFWAEVWAFFEIGVGYNRVLESREMPGARWFPGARLNFAEQLLRRGAAAGPGSRPALVALGEDGPAVETSWDDLRGQVGALAATLRRLGVRPGDRVVGYLPNVAPAVVGLLAAATVGAVWSGCATDIGPESATDRFAQLAPVVLLTADGYRFAGRTRDRRDAVVQLVGSLPSLRTVVHVPVLADSADHLRDTGVDVLTWGQAVREPLDPVFEPVAFDAPLWVVYSSGTTGLPKGLVHGHGGPLLMGLVQQALQYEVTAADRLFWYTSTTWIMWNSLVLGLAMGATAVLYDGSPLHPTPDRLWQLAEDHRVTSLGTSPGYLLACAKAGLRPRTQHDLSALTAVGVTGSPTPPSAYRWVYEEVGDDLALNVISGGTDFVAALVGPAPWLPVTAGEMSCRGLGIHVESWDEQGQPVVERVGELVVLAPMPSMPLRIWGDEDGSRYRDSYFDVFPGVWRHGDWVTITERGTAVVHGRSDSTLNRHGVRMGSSDIYAAVEGLPEVAEALVLGVELADGGYWLPLFVRLAPDVELDDGLVRKIKETVRTHASPRHVPDEVLAIPAVPHTMTGKKLEVPLKRIAQGTPVERAVNLGGVDDPAAVHWFVRLIEDRRRAAERSG